MQQDNGGFVRVIDVPGLGGEAVLAKTSAGTVLLLDPTMSREERMDCMVQVLERDDPVAI